MTRTRQHGCSRHETSAAVMLQFGIVFHARARERERDSERVAGGVRGDTHCCISSADTHARVLALLWSQSSSDAAHVGA